MNSTEVLDRIEIGIKDMALELATNDGESRIRRAMRLLPAPKKTSHRKAGRAVVGGAALLAGGFCLGWKAFRLWHD